MASKSDSPSCWQRSHISPPPKTEVTVQISCPWSQHLPLGLGMGESAAASQKDLWVWDTLTTHHRELLSESTERDAEAWEEVDHPEEDL